MISPSGKRLFEAFESPFSVRKCAQICFVSFDLLIDSEKCLCFEALINCLVLFPYFLYSVHCFLRLQLSRSFCICLMSGVNQYGIRLVLTRLFLIGACLFNCYIINEEKRAISVSTVSWSFADVSRSLVSSVRKLTSLKCLKQR